MKRRPNREYDGFFLFDPRDEVDKRLKAVGFVPRGAKKPLVDFAASRRMRNGPADGRRLSVARRDSPRLPGVIYLGESNENQGQKRSG